MLQARVAIRHGVTPQVSNGFVNEKRYVLAKIRESVPERRRFVLLRLEERNEELRSAPDG